MMSKDGFKRIGSTRFTFGVLILVGMALFFNSCGKDEILPHELPIEELEKSFFQYSQSTTVVNADDFESTIIESTNDFITLTKSPEIDTLIVGDVLMTELYTELEKQQFRFIEGKEDLGNSWRFTTRTATMEQAFDTYYYNSKKPDVIAYRTSFDLASASPLLIPVKAIVRAALKFLSQDYVEAGFDIVLDGTIDVELVHPHVVYLQNLGSLGSNLLDFGNGQALANSMDTDMDGVVDIVEESYGTNINDAQDYPTLRKIDINNFRFTKNEVSFKVGKDSSITISKLDIFDDKVAIKAALDSIPLGLGNLVSSLSNGVPPIAYVPTGVNLPVGGLFLCFFPSLDMSISAEIAAIISMTSNKTSKIEFGVFDLWSLGNSSPQFKISDQATGQVYANSAQFINNTTNIGIDLIGTLTGNVKVGFGFGAAFTLGEPNSAGVSLGGYLLPSAYFTGEGQLGLGVSGLLSSSAPSVQSILDNAHFQACLDFGVGVEGFVFIDAEDPLGVADQLFDAQFQAFESKFTLAGYLAGSNADKLCLPDNCDGVSVQKFDVNVISEELVAIDLNITGPVNNSCEVTILSPSSESLLSQGNIAYGTDIMLSITDMDKISKLKQSKDNLIIKVKDEFQSCTSVSNTYAYYGECAVTEGWNMSASPEHTNSYVPYNNELHDANLLSGTIFLRSLPNDRFHTYYSYPDAVSMCSLLGGRLPTSEEASDISRGDCFGPTGYIVPSDNIVNKILNSDSGLAFVLNPDVVDEDRLFAIWAETSTGGAGNVGRIYARDKSTGNSQNVNVSNTAVSFFAPCLCVRD